MSRFHKIQQRTNVFTMLILVAGLYIAFRYTSFKHGVGWSLTGKPAGTTSWQPASAPFVGWITLGSPLSDTLVVSLQPEVHGCLATPWDRARKRIVAAAPLPVIMTLEPLTISAGPSAKGSTVNFHRTLPLHDIEKGVDRIAVRIPDQRLLALMICSDGDHTNSCLDKYPDAASQPISRDALYYFQLMIRTAADGKIGVVDLQKQGKEEFAALRLHLARGDASHDMSDGKLVPALTGLLPAAAYPPPFVADGKLILSLPVRTSGSDCPPENPE